MNIGSRWLGLFVLFAAAAVSTPVAAQQQQTQKPNIILIVSDDFGYGKFDGLSHFVPPSGVRQR
jgi:hypothetical protein